jgi:uncharacterized RDD family membrane protein YckC
LALLTRKFYILHRGVKEGPYTVLQLLKLYYREPVEVWMDNNPDSIEVKDFEAFKNTFKNHPEVIKAQSEQLLGRFLDPQPPDFSNSAYEYASPGRRLIAWVVNNILLSIIAALALAFSGLESYTYFIGFSLISVILYAVTYSLFSGNIGHLIMGIKVVNADDLQDFREPVKGVVREFLKNALFFLFFILHLWLLIDKRKQNLYDKIFNTIVVRY